MKDRERLKADLGNRKSLASQIRMKSIANLASDNPSKKRRRGGDDDNFGANDDDWGVYRQIAVGEGSDDEEEEDLGAGLKTLEADLLKYDPDFTDEHTLDAQTDWTKSLVHAFLRGPRPFDPKSQQEAYQIHLNVERIRVPEVLFQPSIAGLDQAGIVDIAADILTHRLNGAAKQEDFLKDIFLTGVNSMFQNLDERLRDSLRASLPADSRLMIRRAKNGILDAWKGAARWAGSTRYKSATVTREEYYEKGADYLKVSPILVLRYAELVQSTNIMAGTRSGKCILIEGVRAHGMSLSWRIVSTCESIGLSNVRDHSFPIPRIKRCKRHFSPS